jgi:hypothetical protein
MRNTLLAALLAASTLATGCLSTAHRVPRAELVRLAQLPPEQRGAHVRVTQAWAGDEGPPPAPHVDSGVGVVVVSDGNSGYSSGSGSRGLPTAKESKADAKFWIVVAVAAAIGLAVTEGMRYDGWVKLHPMYPIHLYGWNGEYTWVPLAQLDPQTANWAARAYVREGEGDWTALERAPLDRVGFTYSVLLGTSDFPARSGEDPPGFMSHIQFGVFFNQQLGLQWDTANGWTDNDLGQTVFESRNALELDLLPFSAGSVHGGGFGQLGYGYRIEDGYHGSDDGGYFWGAGGLLQFELTTRLAITARAGVTHIHGIVTKDLTLGLSIY